MDSKWELEQDNYFYEKWWQLPYISTISGTTRQQNGFVGFHAPLEVNLYDARPA